jgi:hypothetical protein
MGAAMTPQPVQADPFGLGALTPRLPNQPSPSAPAQVPSQSQQPNPWDIAGNNPSPPGFWSSAANAAWNTLKSPVEAVIDAVTPHSLAARQQHARDVANNVADTELKGTPEQKSQLHQQMIQSLPFGGTISKVQQGNYGGAAGDVVGGLAGAAALGAVAEGGPAILGKTTRLDSPTSLYQAVTPRVQGADWEASAPTTISDIQRAGQVTDPQAPYTINNVPTAMRAVQWAKNENRTALDTHLDPYRNAGVQIPLDPLADAIDGNIPIDLQIEARTDPSAAQQIQAIHQKAQAYRGQTVSVDQFRDLAKQTNADLNQFHHGTPDVQNSLMLKHGDIASLKAKADAIRNITQQYFGSDAADLQQRWGNLDDINAGLDKAWGKMIMERKPLADVVANAPGKALHGDVTGARQSLRGKTNDLIKDAFDQAQPSGPLPTAQPGQGFGGFSNAIPPSRQLPPGTPQIAAQSPGGYVSNSGLPPGPQMNVWQNIGGQKRLPAPQPGQPPLNVLPSGPSGTARPLPPAGSSQLLDQPGRPLGLPSPPIPREPGQFIVPASDPFRPGAGEPPSPAGTQYHPTSQDLMKTISHSVWRALGGPQ